MTILDTNVFSEPVKPRPEPKVLEWLATQIYHDVYLTAMTTAESSSRIESHAGRQASN